ncbi:immunity 63 family protein [Mycobacterium sp. MBM]|nr:immunity 63 family protein [Mycobacterium sp. MBM]
MIKHVQAGPPELAAQVPATASTVHLRLDETTGDPVFHAALDEPWKIYLHDPAAAAGLPAQRLGRDDAGAFAWVTEVTVWPHRQGDQPHPGMTDFAMNLTYVLDAIQASETPSEHPLAVILIDDLPDELTADPAATPGGTNVVAHTDTGQRSDVTVGSKETQRSAVMTAQPNSAASAGGLILHSLRTNGQLSIDMPVDATLVRPLNPADDTAQRWLVTLGRPARYVAQEHTGAQRAKTISDVVITADTEAATWITGDRNRTVRIAVVTGDDLGPGGPTVAEIGTATVDVVGQPPRHQDAQGDQDLPGRLRERNANIRAQLSIWIARLTVVAGERPRGAPLEIPSALAQPGYCLDQDELIYRPQEGQPQVTTHNDDELLYWIVSDVARSLARIWVRRAPSYRGDADERSRTLLHQRWWTLMSALSTDWGDRAADSRV